MKDFNLIFHYQFVRVFILWYLAILQKNVSDSKYFLITMRPSSSDLANFFFSSLYVLYHLQNIFAHHF